MNVHPVDIGIVVAYLAGMILVGWVASKKIKAFADFFVAGRALTAPLLICSLVSTYYGLEVLFGDAGEAASEGVSVYFVYMRPYSVTTLLAAFVIAGRFRDAKFMSVPDILAHHYGRPAQVAGAIATFFYALPILSIMGMAAIGQVVFGLDLWLGAVIGSVIAVAYTVMGGFWADAMTDTVQFVIMCVTMAIATLFALESVGGFAGIEGALGPEAMSPLGSSPPLYTIAYGLTALSVLVEPAFYQRIFAAKDARTVRIAFLWGLVLWAAYDWAVVTVGMSGGAMQAAGMLPADLPSDQLMLKTCLALLPVGLAGLFLGGCLATAMSTVDSYLLIAAGNIVYDVYRPMRKEVSDRSLIRLTRVSIVLSAAACVVLGLFFDRIKEAWNFMATILSSTVLVPILAAVFARGARRPLAGTLSTWGGLASVLAFYAAMEFAGVPNEELGTKQLEMYGFVILQEYAIYFALPASALGYVVGAIAGRRP